MRRLITWVAGAAGGLAAYKAATRRKVEPEAVVPVEGDPASELRARLAQARAEEAEPEGPDARRRAVHEQARSALDEMSGDGAATERKGR
ncbi:MAG: hypothetical protein ACRDNM_10060 [Gaiellaceae bacterium]